MPATEKLNLGSYDEIYLINPHEILYIQAEDHYSQVLAQGGLSVADGCRCLTKELDMIAC